MDVKDKDCKILSMGRSHQVNGAAAFLQVHLEVMQEEAVWLGELSFVEVWVWNIENPGQPHSADLDHQCPWNGLSPPHLPSNPLC